MEYSATRHSSDHVHLVITPGQGVEVHVALNTLSRRNRDAGFEPRIRVGLLREPYTELPESGVFDAGSFDYTSLEQQANIFYEYYDREAMESLLIEKTGRAILAEIWGDIYARNDFGIHQIHSRRTSCAVPEDIVGHDGALKLYYAEESMSELLLFKFCGQP